MNPDDGENGGEIDGENEGAGEVGATDFTRGQLPPASLSFLITTLATQAMVAIGVVPNPLSGKVESLPNQARHFIDTLAMLDEKTTGNRTPEESELLREVLSQLRLAYVNWRERGRK